MIVVHRAYADLHLSPDNPRRRGIMADEIDETALHIGRKGIINPLGITPDGGITRGQRRYLAIGRLLEWRRATEPGESLVDRVGADDLRAVEARADDLERAVPCVLVEDEDVAIDALADNLHREPMRSYDIAETLVARLARTDKPISMTKLAAELGRSLTWVSRMVSTFKNACPELHRLWEADRVSYKRVKALAELPHDQQRARLESAGPVARGGRPGIDDVRDILYRLRESTSEHAPGADYRRGVLDGLAVVAGEMPVETIERLIAGGDS